MTDFNFKTEVKIMLKKLLAIMLAVVVAIGFTGCGSSDGKIKLAKYKGVVVYKDDIKVTKQDVDNAINQAISQNATEKKVKKGKVGASDKVNVNYKGEINYKGKREAFEGGTAKKQDIDLANDAQNYIEGFTKSIVGHKVGDTFTAKMKFPKTYTNKAKVKGKEVSLAGKPVWFTFKINNLIKKDVPKLTDKFVKEKAKTLFQIDDEKVTTVKALKKYIKREMRKYNISNKIMNNILEESKVIKYDPKELKKEKKRLTQQTLDQYKQQMGTDVTLDAYLKACQMKKKQWDSQITEQAKQSLKQKMFIEKVADNEGLNLSDADYKKEVKKIAKQQGVSVKDFEKQYGKDVIMISLLQQRVNDFIVDNVKEKKGSEPTTTPAPMSTAKTTKKAKSKKK